MGALVLAVLMAAAYSNTFRVPFLLDDADSIALNESLRSFATALFPPSESGITVSGRPLLNLTLAVNYQLHGTEVWGYHAGNLLIHFCAALCLFGVVRRTLGMEAGTTVSARPAVAPYQGKATYMAWFAAALWALHPMQTESVTYIIQRAESLVGLCYLFTLYTFIRGAGTGSQRWLAAACAGCWLGMAAKEVMATAPLMVLLYDRTFLAGTFRAAWAKRRWVYVAMACSWLLLLGLVVVSGGRGNTVGYAFISWFDYALMQGPGIVTYLWHAILPVNLVFDYGAILEKRMPVLIGGVVLVACLVVVTGVLLKYRPKVGFLGAWLFVILAPTSSVIPVATQTLAEHRMYLPLACVPLAVVLLVYRFAARRAWVQLSALVLLLAVMSWDRNRDYRSAISIWEDTVEKVPDNMRALNNLSVEYMAVQRFDDAVRVLREAADINERDMTAQANLGEVLAKIAMKRGVENRRTGDDWQAGSLAERLSADSDMKEALVRLKAAADKKKENPHFQGMYGSALYQVGRFAEAAGQFEAALAAMKGKDASPFQWFAEYGDLLRQLKRYPEAITKLEAAVKASPRYVVARCNLGLALLESGRVSEGIVQLEEARRLDAENPRTLYHLFNAYAESERPAEAIPLLEKLIAVSAPSAELRSNLGVLYARAGRIGEAIMETRKALEIDPAHAAARENLERLLAFAKEQSGG